MAARPQRATAGSIAIEQKVLLIVSWLLAMLAIASIAVLVGGRMAEQTRRVGLLKAVGGTPTLVAVVLLAENLLLALAAAVVGLLAGELLAPLLDQRRRRTARQPRLALADRVLGRRSWHRLAAAVAAAATLVPAHARRAHEHDQSAQRPRPSAAAPAAADRDLRAAPGAAAARSAPGRAPPTPHASWPRRASLIAVAMVVAALTLQHQTRRRRRTGRRATGFFPGSSIGDRVSHLVYILSAILVDPRRDQRDLHRLGDGDRRRSGRPRSRAPSARHRGRSAPDSRPPSCSRLWRHRRRHTRRARALRAGRRAHTRRNPPILWLLAVIPGTLLAVAALTAIPAQIGAHRSIAQTLAAE